MQTWQTWGWLLWKAGKNVLFWYYVSGQRMLGKRVLATRSCSPSQYPITEKMTQWYSVAGLNTVESGYKVYVCPRGNLLYCRPYFINDPTVKSHRRVAYTLPSLCSLEFHFFNQELKSNDVIHAFLLASYATGRFLIFFMHLGTRHPAVFEAYLPLWCSAGTRCLIFHV